MKLDEKTLRLIAVGASFSTSCLPCLQTNVAKAREAGAEASEIAEAIRVGALVRLASTNHKDKFAVNKSQLSPLSVILPTETCGCSDIKSA